MIRNGFTKILGLQRFPLYGAIFSKRISEFRSFCLVGFTFMVAAGRLSPAANMPVPAPSVPNSTAPAWQEIHSCRFENICSALESGANVYTVKVVKIDPAGKPADDDFGDIGHIRLKVLSSIKGHEKRSLNLPYSGTWKRAHTGSWNQIPYCGGSLQYGWAANKKPEVGQLLLCVVVPNGYDRAVEVPKDAPWEDRLPLERSRNLIMPNDLPEIIDGNTKSSAGKQEASPTTNPAAAQSTETKRPASEYSKIVNADMDHWDGAACTVCPLNSESDSIVSEYKEIVTLFSLKDKTEEVKALSKDAEGNRDLVTDYVRERNAELKQEGK